MDLSYAIHGKLPRWPGDTRVFKAKTNATVKMHGYFTRSFWMLEHYGTHLDAPAHFPPGKKNSGPDSPGKTIWPRRGD